MRTRIRSAAAVVVGASALSALALPAVQAAPAGPSAPVGPAGPAGPADDVQGDTQISNVIVNDGKSIMVGSTGKASVTVKLTASDPNGISDAGGILYHGTDVNHNDWGVTLPSCGKHLVTTYTCAFALKSTSARHFGVSKNAQAGTWKMWAYAIGADGDYRFRDPAKTFKVLRATKLTANAAPEPVKKGKTITVTGSLTRADWEGHKDIGYGSQSVVLQFRKAGTTNYVNVKGIKSTSTGSLKTTVTAATDGYYRFTYAGSATAGAVSATGDSIDVR
ncbi:calcium-binding protein [Streptomyces sp. NPDC056672]|uniref:calcium-binding protein n=1 Tax=Streptomyces sp. NPDC056672 TaxID=3345906 RepID=UPI0036782142